MGLRARVEVDEPPFPIQRIESVGDARQDLVRPVLRRLELFLRLDLRRDVQECHGHARGTAAGTELRVPKARDPAFDSVVADHTVLDPAARSSGAILPHRLHDPLTIVRRNMFEQVRNGGVLIGAARDAERPIAHDFLIVLRRVGQPRLQVEFGVGQPPGVNGEAQPLLALTQRGLALSQRQFGPLSIGDVQVDARHAQWRAIVRELDLAQLFHPASSRQTKARPDIRIGIRSSASRSRPGWRDLPLRDPRDARRQASRRVAEPLSDQVHAARMFPATMSSRR